jgi:hypothetical protein
MKNTQDDAAVGVDAFRAFALQFGADDIYNRIIVEEILKVLLGFKEEEEKDGNTTD